MCIDKDGKESQTKVKVLSYGYFNDEKVTKVLLYPHTGRRHQLRVHLQSIGHPILGDYTYSKDKFTERMLLHAKSLKIPIDEEEMKFEANENFDYEDLKFEIS
jgi:23S rRNA-/tRNA-specific pseudouridylate synthase